jgi:hypothetical protein
MVYKGQLEKKAPCQKDACEFKFRRTAGKKGDGMVSIDDGEDG